MGVQLVAPRQVSRTKTWRRPLLGVAAVAAFGVAAGVPEAVAVEPLFVARLFVTATNATNLPLALIDGRIDSVPVKAPPGSVEINDVAGVHDPDAPWQVSRK